MKLWESGKYYSKARKGSSDFDHPGMILLKKLSSDSEKILDLGCGEGTRLNFVAGEKYGVGVDISKHAIQSAKNEFPGYHFRNMNLEKLKLADNSFDLVYSAYVLEHLNDAEKVLKEAIRVLKPGGKLVLIAPNYGSPNRTSPLNNKGRVRKLLKGFLSDLTSLFVKRQHLKWNKVEPLDSVEEYIQDFDTTLEPYIGSLIEFLRNKGMKVVYYSSCWQEELENPKFQQKIFRILGENNVYPFLLWGPHLVVESEKI